MDDQVMLMNPHERAILENFLDQLVRVRGPRKIREADAMIRAAVDRQPDAAYLLVQRSLMLRRGLEKTKARLATYESAQGQRGPLDAGAPNAKASTPPQPTLAPSAPHRSQGLPPDPVSALRVTPPASPEPSRDGGAANFLGQAAAKSAGIAGGAFLSQGLENLIDDYIDDDDYARLIG
jgi:hypothetical protein